MNELARAEYLNRYRSSVAIAALLLLGSSLAGLPLMGRAQAQVPPPLPGGTGPGSLPSDRATAAAEAAAAAAGATGTTGTEGEGEVTEPGSPQIRLGAGGFPISGAPTPPMEPGRRWTVTPSIGLELLGTDNLNQTVKNRQSDLITSILPALTASADTSRFRGIMNYSPIARFYADTPGQNRLDHNFNGQALGIVVPDLLYIDLRGSSAVQSISGGTAPEATPITNRRNTLQTTSLQVSPYLLHRFGDLMTVQAGYGFQYVDQDSGAQQGQPSTTINGLPAFVSQHYTAHEVYAVGRTGADLGRLALEARIGNTQYIGTGVLDGAYRRAASVEARYAVLRGVSPLVEVGYEQQRYSGTPGVRIDGPIWSVGVRIDFSAESYIIAKYGRRDGFNSATLLASLALGGRTRLSASYEERLSTSAMRAGDLLSTTTLDELGNPIDLATGLPYVLPFANSFLGVQNSLLRLRLASAALVQNWPRDTLALGFSYQEQTPVSTAPGTASFPQNGTSISFTWAHELTERTFATAYVQYGSFSSGLLGDGDVVSGSLTLSHQLQPRLFGSIQFATSSRSDATSSGRATQNIILLALRQTF